jgi:hypothetical protein
MYPSGHARNREADLKAILRNKFTTLGALAVDDPESLIAKLSNLKDKSAGEIASLYDCKLTLRDPIE